MVATWIKVGVKPDLYRTETQWMPSLFPEKIKRAGLEPSQLFAVKDLKAYTGLGAITINPQSDAAQAAGITTPQIGQRWTVLTGLIPIKEQLDVYVNLYSSSVQPDPMRDFPVYRLYEVERAQIEPGQTADQLKWEKIEFLPDYLKNVTLWGTTALDPVDPTYIAPGQFPMAYPLPPVDKKYGEEVAHPPFIPLLTDSQIKMNKEVEKFREKQLKNMFKVDARDFLEADPFSGGGGMRSSEMGDNMSGSGNRGGTSRKKRTQEEEEEDFKPVEVSNYLFRFFDFSVEPGKTYKYRIRLLLANPNYRMPPNVLTDESIAKEPILKTDFCPPTNAVTVPLESRVLVTNVADSRSAWEDPTASILAVHFDLSDGSEWCVNKDRITRGSTVNYPKQNGENFALANKTKTGTMGDGMSSDMPMDGPPQRGRKPPAKPAPAVKKDDESKKEIEVISDVCVLDVFGGQRLQFVGNVDGKTQDLRSPGKMVVLEPSGNLVIHKVSTDLQEVNTVKNPVAVQRGGMYGGSSMSGP
jgi:hypothetical protein